VRALDSVHSGTTSITEIVESMTMM